MKFTSSSQEAQLAGVKLAVYSPAGMGKTVLAATLPDPVMLSAESGTLSIKKSNLERLFGVGNPTITYDMPIIIVSTIADLEDAFRYLAGSHEARGFRSVALDSLSEIAEVVLNAALAKAKDPRQAYGELQDRMSVLIRGYRDLHGKNVYMSCKMGSSKDDVTGLTRFTSMMPGNKLPQQVPYFFDEFFAYRTGRTPEGKEFRYLQTHPCMQYEGKDRSGVLNQMEYPHLGNIISKIQNS